jgi:hypothetical protein
MSKRKNSMKKKVHKNNNDVANTPTIVIPNKPLFSNVESFSDMSSIDSNIDASNIDWEKMYNKALKVLSKAEEINRTLSSDFDELSNQIQTETKTFSEEYASLEKTNASLTTQIQSLECERDELRAKCTSFQADLVSARADLEVFTNRTRVLDNILESQRSSSNRQGLGFVDGLDPLTTTTFVPPETIRGSSPSRVESPSSTLPKQPDHPRGRKNSRNNSPRKVFKCSHCKRLGHTSSYCWDLCDKSFQTPWQPRKQTRNKNPSHRNSYPPSHLDDPLPLKKVFDCSYCGRKGHTSQFCWDRINHVETPSSYSHPSWQHVPYSWNFQVPRWNSYPVFPPSFQGVYPPSTNPFPPKPRSNGRKVVKTWLPKPIGRPSRHPDGVTSSP